MDYNFLASDEEKHSAAHVLAIAIRRHFPGTRIGVGPVTRDGFYYDVELPKHPTNEDIKEIQSIANHIVEENLPFRQMFVRRESAENTLLQLGEIYKAELIRSIPDEEISFYKTGEEFLDLCRGPHVNSTGVLGYIHVEKIVKTHWKEDPSRPAMLRFFGKLFRNKGDYEQYLESQKVAKLNDFKVVGQKLGIFLHAGQQIILSPRGTALLKRIERYIDSSFSATNLSEVDVPKSHLLEYIYTYFFKQRRSYRNLPTTIKISHTDDVKFNDNFYQFKFLLYKAIFEDSTIDNILMGTIDSVTRAFVTLTDSLVVNIKTPNVEDSTVSSISTYLQRKVISHNKIVSNIAEPGIFELECKVEGQYKKSYSFAKITYANEVNLGYSARDGSLKNPKSLTIEINLLHVLAFILEELQLKLPYALHPTTAIVIPINSNYEEYAIDLAQTLKQFGIVCKTDFTSKSLRRKIRIAEKVHYPYILVVGNKEQINNAASVRQNGSEIGLLTVDDIIKRIQNGE